MITIALCDDEGLHASQAESIIRETILDERLCDISYRIETFCSSNELLAFAEREHIDLLLLDIHMPDPDGIAVAKHFNESYPDTLIVFLSNYEQYVFYSNEIFSVQVYQKIPYTKGASRGNSKRCPCTYR